MSLISYMYIFYFVASARVHSCIISHMLSAISFDISIWMMKPAECNIHLGIWYLTFRLITPPNTRLTNKESDINKGYIFGTKPRNISDYQIGCQLGDI